jgi:hypothetical protein
MKILKERTPEVIREYTLEFRWKDDPDAGFSFPAKTNELPDFEKMTPEAKANYERCLTDERILGPEFEVREWTYINPAVGKCSCGAEVILDSDYAGAVRCECGKWYNVYGQELRDPEYWEEDDSDYYDEGWED